MMKSDKFNIVIIGATGLVGSRIISILDKRSFPIGELRLCSSPGGIGREIVEDEKSYFAKPFDDAVFNDADIVFFSGPDDLSPEYAPKAIDAGAVVIDNSAHFRMNPDVPLVVPEVNAHRIAEHKGLIANPNCTTAGLVVALAPVEKELGLEWVAASSYQAVSGAGAMIMERFIEGTKRAVQNDFQNLNPKDLPFNAVPAIGSFNGDQNFSEEDRLINETRKILEKPELMIFPTCVRVPVINVHSIAAVFRTSKEFKDGELQYILSDSPGLEIVDDPMNRNVPTPVLADGKDAVMVGRIRRFDERTGGMWVVADNLRKGAALNAVQIAEILVKQWRGKS
jgi:aspartate-semialdehyde dehydrogenase